MMVFCFLFFFWCSLALCVTSLGTHTHAHPQHTRSHVPQMCACEYECSRRIERAPVCTLNHVFILQGAKGYWTLSFSSSSHAVRFRCACVYCVGVGLMSYIYLILSTLFACALSLLLVRLARKEFRSLDWPFGSLCACPLSHGTYVWMVWAAVNSLACVRVFEFLIALNTGRRLLSF